MMAKRNTSERIKALKQLNEQLTVSNLNLFRSFFDKSQKTGSVQNRANAA